MYWWKDNVLVLNTDKDNMEKVKTFLESFGLEFALEKHGKGPEHYSCEVDGKVLEIYPG